MKFYSNGKLHLKFNTKTEYPYWGILVVIAIICLSIFTSELLSFAAFALCIYRTVRYDAKIFAVDYCVLVPFSQVFKAPGGLSYLVLISLFAAVWYFFKGRIKANSAFVCVFVILVYFITRMQMDIVNFVLCFSQIFIVYVLMQRQNTDSAEKAAKAFCSSLLFASLFALLIRNTPQLIAVRGRESAAMWGVAVKRFQGLYSDPNYYMVTIMIGIALLAKLKDCGKIDIKQFLVFGALFSLCGFMTFSKTFFMAFIIFGMLYILWQFRNRNYGKGLLLIGGSVGAAAVVFTANINLFSLILARFINAEDINDLTTGRTDIFIRYIEEISKSPQSMFFGYGFAAKGLNMDPHNIYIEILYYVGIIGLLLMLWFCAEMCKTAKKQAGQAQKQNFFSKYIVLMMFAVLYFTLQGFFALVAYTELFLAFISIMIVKKDKLLKNDKSLSGEEKLTYE